MGYCFHRYIAAVPANQTHDPVSWSKSHELQGARDRWGSLHGNHFSGLSLSKWLRTDFSVDSAAVA
jgi:hypothetical protein